jgi:hypothetical protein
MFGKSTFSVLVNFVFLSVLLTVAVGSQRSTSSRSSSADSQLTGLFRINIDDSDKLYSVVSGASSKLPYREQQRFFIDLAVRLTPPDQFSIEQHGQNIQIASSRAARISFDADGVTHIERAANGNVVRTRATLTGDRLEVNTEGATEDRFNVAFEPVDGGRRLRVTRHIYAIELNQPVVINSIYDKVSEVARWEIYGEPENLQPAVSPVEIDRATGERASARTGANNDASTLRSELDEWIAATNGRNIGRQMTYYVPVLSAYYLKRNVPLADVRAEKNRVFRQASTIDVRADAPEIVFADSGRTAIMRYRKQYNIENGKQSRRGQVIQELRWQKTDNGWKIFSERDVKVLK